MSVPGELHALVERFDRDRDSYRSGRYKEAQAGVDSMNPLLGWVVENRQGRPEAYRDVIYEDRIKVGDWAKAPGYGFYAGGRRRATSAGCWCAPNAIFLPSGRSFWWRSSSCP